MATEHFDVLIIGAGLSGIDTAYRLQTRCPGKSYAILEARGAIAGTWDLFRYPGVRSDSDMYTLGFPFRPWRGERAIVDGGAIRDYIRETASAFGIDRTMRFGHRVVSANWSSADALWSVSVRLAWGGEQVFTCRFLLLCAGYYDYEKAYLPDFPGMADFRGRLVHPQHWPEDLSYDGKRVLIVGSGATAVTLAPSMARMAEHVTILQRSPSYIVALPSRDAIAGALLRRLPHRFAHRLIRWKNILLTIYFYNRARSKPEATKRSIVNLARKQVGPDFDVSTHLTPGYNPWDQRLCIVPDGDLFRAIRAGKIDMVTDHIERFTPAGIALRSGAELAADIIVTATGLNLKLAGGMAMSVDGNACDLGKTLLYKGAMCSGIPNCVFTIGYTNASWTLKADLTAQYTCRLINYMDARGYIAVTPIPGDEGMPTEPTMPLTAGYVERASSLLPRQGARTPWKLHQNFVRDWVALCYGKIDDGALVFSGDTPNPSTASRSPSPLRGEEI